MLRKCLIACCLVLVLYALSFGPACWWFSAPWPGIPGRYIAPKYYWPIGYLMLWYPSHPAARVFGWYSTVGTVGDVFIPAERQWMNQ